MKKTTFLIMLAMMAFTLRAQTDSETIQRCKAETQEFLKATPIGLQHRQSEAVRRAIKGDTDALMAVRQSRSVAPQLTAGVKAIEADSWLTLYCPTKPHKKMPLLIYLHGGGWAFGSRNSCAKFCMALAAKGIAVLAVEYPLAPEAPYPAALDACSKALEMAHAKANDWGIDPERLSIGGDSAGGNLALATALKHDGNGISSLVLFYPVVKAYADESQSWKDFGEGFGLDAELMDAFNLAYASQRERNPLISPAHANEEDLRKLPPVLLVAADHDILRDQGQAFSKHIKKLGVATEYRLIPETVHLFITVDGQPTAFSLAVKYSYDFLTRENKLQ